MIIFTFQHADSFRSRHLTEIFLTLFSSGARTAPLNCRGIVLMATAESTASLHSLINAFHIFKEVIHVSPPNKEGRRDVGSQKPPLQLESLIILSRYLHG
jgi:peroxin-1